MEKPANQLRCCLAARERTKTAVSYLIDPSVPVQVHWTQLTCSVPQDIRDMADEPSQYLQLPDAYRPEMLAMLDLQCRNFLQ